VILKSVHRDLIVGANDQCILFSLVIGNSELCIHIVLKIVIISVEVIRCDICDDRDIGTETEHIVQLKTAQLQNIMIKIIFRHLKRRRTTLPSQQRLRKLSEGLGWV
jgi:hypothetical protein